MDCSSNNTNKVKKTWKVKSRTGGIRRKVLKEYLSIISSDKNQPATNKIEPTISSCEGDQSATVNILKDSSVYNINNTERDNCENQSKCSSDGHHSAIIHFSEEGSVQSKNYENVECSPLDDESNITPYSSCSDESDTNDDYAQYNKQTAFRKKIRIWAVEKQISHDALRDLAGIMNELIPQILPKDPRSILATPRKINIKLIQGGEYWHNGIANPLVKILQNWTDVPDKIALNINFDGLPIFKSAKHEFWPILCNIFENQRIKPFIIGIYFGVGKPKDLGAYLDDFVNEMKILLEVGIKIPQTEQTVKINIRSFICDSPARAYIKGVCNFNGKHGCLKCVTIGEYSHSSHTVVFPNTRCPERTNDGFRNKIYGAHHKSDSPLLTLPIDMVKDFPVGDSLHLIDLGIMKRLLVGWRDGNFGKRITKWRASDIEKVTQFLKQSEMPSEVHRKIRGLDTLAYWKASEFRAFFYYLSIVILYEVLSPDAYCHFLMLYCGITICSSKNYRPMLPLAEELLRYFVEHYKDFYGAEYVTSNVHNLLHVTKEVENYGILNSFNAYPFENKLYMIKRMLRSGQKPLQQVANRLAEDMVQETRTDLTVKKSEYPFIATNQKLKNVLHFEHFTLSAQTKNCYFLTVDNEIIEINRIINVTTINGFKLNNMEDVFVNPIKSSRLDIYKCKIVPNVHRVAVVLNPVKIKCKLVCVKRADYKYFVPLLHTLTIQ